MPEFPLLALIVQLGVAGGFGLGLISPEELTPGKRWLELFSAVAFGLVAFFIGANQGYVFATIALILVTLALGWTKQYLPAYVLMGLFLYSFEYTGTLMLIAGLPLGSLVLAQKLSSDTIKGWQKALPGLALYFLFYPASLLPFALSYL